MPPLLRGTTIALLLLVPAACAKGPAPAPYVPPAAALPGTLEALLADPVEGLEVIAFSTGDIEVPGIAMLDPEHPSVRPEDTAGKVRIANLAYLVRHPAAGDILVDTGLGTQFVGKPHGDLGWYTRRAVKTWVESGRDVRTGLAAAGVDPADLEMVVITHGHIDHTGGLPDLGPVDVLVGQQEAAAIRAPVSIRKGFKAKHFAKARSLREIRLDGATEVEGLGPVVDLVGDGSVLAMDTRGHTPGHLSVFVNGAGGPWLIAGDVVQTPFAAEEGISSGNCHDLERARREATRIRDLKRSVPSLKILYAHVEAAGVPAGTEAP